MATDSFLALTCVGSIALLYGFILAFAGYRFFLFLLPFWGFFFGFSLGAQSIQALFNEGFLATLSSWVVGFFLGLVFAVISYFFFAAAVAILAGSLGYGLGVGIMTGIGFEMGILAWLVGVVVAIAFIVGVFYLSLYKWLIIIATSILGAGTIVGVFLFLFGKIPTSQLVQNPVKTALDNSPFWLIVAIAIAILGFMTQYATTRNWTLRSYSRWDETFPNDPSANTEIVIPPAAAGTTVGFTPAMAGASAADVPPTTQSSSEPSAGGTA